MVSVYCFLLAARSGQLSCKLNLPVLYQPPPVINKHVANVSVTRVPSWSVELLAPLPGAGVHVPAVFQLALGWPGHES